MVPYSGQVPSRAYPPRPPWAERQPRAALQGLPGPPPLLRGETGPSLPAPVSRKLLTCRSKNGRPSRPRRSPPLGPGSGSRLRPPETPPRVRFPGTPASRPLLRPLLPLRPALLPLRLRLLLHFRPPSSSSLLDPKSGFPVPVSPGSGCGRPAPSSPRPCSHRQRPPACPPWGPGTQLSLSVHLLFLAL